jgi:flavin reductase (DIM6/NTAB) family NADH-FMN oxidoreductase RutF
MNDTTPSPDGSPITRATHTLATADAAPTPRELRSVYSRYPTGVVAVCAEVDGALVGMVATSFSVGVSFDPPLTSLAVQASSKTWPVLRRADRIGVSVLADDQAETCLQLSSRDRDRFDGVPIARCDQDDAVLVDGAAVWMEAVVHQEVPAGDHGLVLLRITSLRVHEQRAPLVYHSMEFRSLAF